jgi:hypothetical protein
MESQLKQSQSARPADRDQALVWEQIGSQSDLRALGTALRKLTPFVEIGVREEVAVETIQVFKSK